MKENVERYDRDDGIEYEVYSHKYDRYSDSFFKTLEEDRPQPEEKK